MLHLDLFSGIGGFAYAAQQVWGDAYENAGFCEIDHFCQQVLKKNFPEATIHADIRTLAVGDGKRLQRAETEERRYSGSVDLITGGFPCQSFSVAGKRRGTSDNRYLWPEMFMVIQKFQPAWVIAENVSGLLTWKQGVVFDTVCSDLEGAGYEVQPFIIPAAAVGAPHRRDRLWFVAHAPNQRLGGLGLEWEQDTQAAEHGVDDSDAPDAGSTGRRKGRKPRIHQGQQTTERQEFEHLDWQRDWQEVAFATCLPRMDDGVPARLVRFPDGNTVTEAKWRNEAIKAYGNAIVPGVAMRIMQAIKEADS